MALKTINAQGLTSYDAYSLLVEALMEKGYSRSDLQDFKLFRRVAKASICLNDQAVVSVTFEDNGSGVLTFTDAVTDTRAKFYFDGSYEDLMEVFNTDLEDNRWYLP